MTAGTVAQVTRYRAGEQWDNGSDCWADIMKHWDRQWAWQTEDITHPHTHSHCCQQHSINSTQLLYGSAELFNHITAATATHRLGDVFMKQTTQRNAFSFSLTSPSYQAMWSKLKMFVLLVINRTKFCSVKMFWVLSFICQIWPLCVFATALSIKTCPICLRSNVDRLRTFHTYQSKLLELSLSRSYA